MWRMRRTSVIVWMLCSAVLQAAETPLYRADFSAALGPDWQVVDGRVAVENGRLTVRSDRSNPFVRLNRRFHGDLSVRVRLLGGPGSHWSGVVVKDTWWLTLNNEFAAVLLVRRRPDKPQETKELARIEWSGNWKKSRIWSPTERPARLTEVLAVTGLRSRFEYAGRAGRSSPLSASLRFPGRHPPRHPPKRKIAGLVDQSADRDIQRVAGWVVAIRGIGFQPVGRRDRLEAYPTARIARLLTRLPGRGTMDAAWGVGRSASDETRNVAAVQG